MTSVIDENVLVLNRNWQAITFVPVKTAITTVLRDMASVLDTENYYLLSFEEWVKQNSCNSEDKVAGRWIKTPSMKILVPDIIVLKKYGERPPRKISFTRPNLYRRDEFHCQYCGAELPGRKLTIDHVVPRSRGGQTNWTNCVASCKRCNEYKADRLPKEARMSLKKKPDKPGWKPGLKVPSPISKSWMPFIEKEAL